MTVILDIEVGETIWDTQVWRQLGVYAASWKMMGNKAREITGELVGEDNDFSLNSSGNEEPQKDSLLDLHFRNFT